ncbi:MAG: hypothetical protein JOY76_04335 [Hyphomicrobiales bacterium]|nr:hypothetical protein [Hyphomicrobiales bacterium]
MATVRTLEEELFLLMTLGADRNVAATYVMGERVHGGPGHVARPKAGPRDRA